MYFHRVPLLLTPNRCVVQSLCVPHLAVPVVFGLCFIEDGKRPGDDQTQFLMESQETAPFISVILSS